MRNVEIRVVDTGNMTSRVQQVERVEVPVFYGSVETEVILRESYRVNPAPRTLSNRERRELRDQNRVGGRIGGNNHHGA